MPIEKDFLCYTYRSLVCSKIEYGCVVYDAASQAVKKIRDTVQHHVIKATTPVFLTSRIISMLVAINEMSLEIRCKMLAMLYAIKVGKITYTLHISSHFLLTPASTRLTMARMVQPGIRELEFVPGWRRLLLTQALYNRMKRLMFNYGSS